MTQHETPISPNKINKKGKIAVILLGVFHPPSDHSFPQHFEVFEGSNTFQEGVFEVYEKSTK